MKIVKECDSLFEAQVVKERLESEEIPAVVLNENASNYVPFAAAIPSLATKVAVDDADYERARALLFGEEADNKRIVCPQCGSGNVRSVLDPNAVQRIGIYFLCFLSLFGSNSPGHIRRHLRCRDCGEEFH